MYEGMFDDFVQLRPLKACASYLASFKDWPYIYDIEKLKKYCAIFDSICSCCSALISPTSFLSLLLSVCVPSEIRSPLSLQCTTMTL